MDHKWLADAVIIAPPTDQAGQLAAIAKTGDPLAGFALVDHLKEEGVQDSPFRAGDKVFIFTVTLYYVGEVEDVGLGWVRLKNASWVHWTGRLSSLFATGDLTRQHGGRKPRTEYLDELTVLTQSIVSFRSWPGKLPKESIAS